jgi:DNA-binding MltR family transcriptional regulator
MTDDQQRRDKEMPQRAQAAPHRRERLISRDRRKASPASSANVPVFETLMLETDRGCALVAADMIGEELDVLLRAKFISESGIHDKDLDTLMRGVRAPLGDFAARANIAYALGLIEADTWKALDVLRELRNEFAHSHGPKSFTDQQVERIFSSFTQLTDHRQSAILAAGFTIASGQPADGLSLNRQSFMVSVSVLFVDIKLAIEPLMESGPQTPPS